MDLLIRPKVLNSESVRAEAAAEFENSLLTFDNLFDNADDRSLLNASLA